MASLPAKSKLKSASKIWTVKSLLLDLIMELLPCPIDLQGSSSMDVPPTNPEHLLQPIIITSDGNVHVMIVFFCEMCGAHPLIL
jgi:hypothetical protein